MNEEKPLSLIFKELLFKGAVKNQAEFGQKLGYKPSFTSRLVAGKEKEPQDLRNKISQTFGVEVPAQPNTEKPTPSEAGNTNLELNEALTRALIRAHDEMIEANTAHRKLTSALLEEKDRRIAAEAKGASVQAVQASLDELRSMIARNFQHDEKVDLFLAEQIAKLAKIPKTKILEMLHRAMIDEPTAQSMSKSVGSGSLSKA